MRACPEAPGWGGKGGTQVSKLLEGAVVRTEIAPVEFKGVRDLWEDLEPVLVQMVEGEELHLAFRPQRPEGQIGRSWVVQGVKMAAPPPVAAVVAVPDPE